MNVNVSVPTGAFSDIDVTGAFKYCGTAPLIVTPMLDAAPMYCGARFVALVPDVFHRIVNVTLAICCCCAVLPLGADGTVPPLPPQPATNTAASKAPASPRPDRDERNVRGSACRIDCPRSYARLCRAKNDPTFSIRAIARPRCPFEGSQTNPCVQN
jgi:hypothetical protein